MKPLILTLLLGLLAAACPIHLLAQTPADPPRQASETNRSPSVAPSADTLGNPAQPPAPAPEPSDDFAFTPDQNLTLTEDLAELNFAKLAVDIWQFRIFTVNGDAITVGKLCIALVILILGLWIAKRVAAVVRGRLGKVRRVDVNAAAAISKVLYYLLALVFAFIALDFAGIPLTIFTVLGGAIAIGIGFGVQNLFNNLISSLILMVERPIRLGDIVVVDGQEGRVEDIGNRCTRLRRTDGIDVLIPNSFFLEQPVVNWTLLDNDVRGKVAVGVAYGSDTTAVKRIITEAVNDHPKVKVDPRPVVLFQAFGDNSLNFETWFWVVVKRPLELVTVESDLRFTIDAACREHGIEIAFPQRDVHLDVTHPIEIKNITKKD